MPRWSKMWPHLFLKGITLASVATRSWWSTCWPVVRFALDLLGFALPGWLRLCRHFLRCVSPSLPPGAKSEVNTFDGERCMYGSLNDSIRHLLKDYKFVSVYAMKRGDFNYFLHM